MLYSRSFYWRIHKKITIVEPSDDSGSDYDSDDTVQDKDYQPIIVAEHEFFSDSSDDEEETLHIPDKNEPCEGI